MRPNQLTTNTAGNRIKTATKEMKKLSTYLLLLLGVFALAGCGSTKSIPVQSPSTTYKIGDVYNQNGVQGVVVKVDATGQHGIIMSLEGSKEKWTSDKRFNFETNAFYEDDGQKNMEAIAKYVESGKASWSDFPIFNWAKSLGEGWYIPAKNEAAEIWKNMSGGTGEYKFSNIVKNDFQKFDKKQRSYGGAKLVDDRFYIGTKKPYAWYTSTEGEGGNVYSYQFDMSDVKGELIGGFSGRKFAPWLTPKRPLSMSLWKSRAIHKF